MLRYGNIYTQQLCTLTQPIANHMQIIMQNVNLDFCRLLHLSIGLLSMGTTPNAALDNAHKSKP